MRLFWFIVFVILLVLNIETTVLTKWYKKWEGFLATTLKRNRERGLVQIA